MSTSDGRKFEFLVNAMLTESGRLYKLKHKDRMELSAPWTRREETVEIFTRYIRLRACRLASSIITCFSSPDLTYDTNKAIHISQILIKDKKFMNLLHDTEKQFRDNYQTFIEFANTNSSSSIMNNQKYC